MAPPEPQTKIVPNPPPNPPTIRREPIVPNPASHPSPATERTRPTPPPTTPPLKK
ncbi:hypothetical protein [Pyxidicoccus sp. MSG2]|uniref:hypothetical protein n=1 Tax=Pyxidicoccus sp. MSG2 TaxID=2996790 RepID=UPI00226FE4FE|nr:hypothetical protein [Pyxidicoccus sp. MSG2]MCY1014648.1 hypothetical protein [Pyxidicoccus sp. MSG2]